MNSPYTGEAKKYYDEILDLKFQIHDLERERRNNLKYHKYNEELDKKIIEQIDQLKEKLNILIQKLDEITVKKELEKHKALNEAKERYYKKSSFARFLDRLMHKQPQWHIINNHMDTEQIKRLYIKK